MSISSLIESFPGSPSRRSFLQGLGAGTLAMMSRAGWSASVPASVNEMVRSKGKKISLLHDGGFTGSAWGWQLTEGARVVKLSRLPGHRSICVDSQSGEYARFLVLAPEVGKTYTLSGWVKTEKIASRSEESGAYFSAIQFEFQGRPTDFTVDGRQLPEKHFGLWHGTEEWQHFSQSFTCERGATGFEVVVGIFRTSGRAWFTDLTFVEGTEPASIDEVVEVPEALALMHQAQLAASPRSKPRAAILRDALPVRGAASNPEVLASLLAGFYETEFLTAKELADAARLNRAHFDLLVLAYGQTFPLAAAENVQNFLAAGGDLFTTGGYAFQSPVIEKNGKWIFADEALSHEHAANFLPPFAHASNRWSALDAHSAYIAESDFAEASGALIAVVELPAHHWNQSAGWSCEIAAEGEGRQYYFSAWVRMTEVVPAPQGAAFVGVEQLDGEGNHLWADNFDLHANGADTPWHKVERLFFLRHGCARLRVRVLLENATGKVECASPVLEERAPQIRINTAKGHPQDELVVDARQIGIFDADFHLRRVSAIKPAEGQHVLAPFDALKGNFTGYAATCVVGMNHARWIPLLEAYDGAGSKRGAAGAMAHHARGAYARSSWAFFGVENFDLFAAENRQGAEIAHAVARSLSAKCTLHSISSDLACYRQGEEVHLQVEVSNFGRNDAALEVRWSIGEFAGKQERHGSQQPLHLRAGESRLMAESWKPASFADERYVVRVQLLLDTHVVDEIETGFVVWNEETLGKGLALSFKKNYFEVEGKSLFLQGTDDYLHTFVNEDEHPLTWDADARGCRDSCIDVYENLMGLRGPQQRPTRVWWRWIDAMLLNVQRAGGAFFPGMLIFSNTAITARDLEEQRAYVTAFARRYKNAAGIMYYLNGDLELHDPNVPEIERLYNEYLRQKYGSDEALRKAWRVTPPEAPMGSLKIKPGADVWNDLRTLDDFEFRVEMVKRWLNAMYDAIRSEDAQHPVTAEFYQLPYAGIDILTALGKLDLANFGYFQLDQEDYYRFPQTCKLLDQRVRGKGINIGEFGVKTHPAWADAEDYIRARSESYEQKYFLAIAHYGFALGASKIQNWCWKYPSDLPFEWGINYQNELIGRDVRAFYRNTGLFFRNLHPRYEPSDVLLLIPGANRKGGEGRRVLEGVANAIRLLMDQRVEFNTLADDFIDEIPTNTKTIFYPLPYCPSTQIYARLEEFVRNGGQLYISGDISYNSIRERACIDRLERLCGLRFFAERYAGIDYSNSAVPVIGKSAEWPNYAGAPGMRLALAGAEALAVTEENEPVVAQFACGKGKVIFSADPVELHGDARYADYAQKFYAALCSRFALQREQIEPADAHVHCFRVASQDKREIRILVHHLDQGPSQSITLSTAAGKVRMALRARMTGAVVSEAGKGIVAVESSGDVVLDGKLQVAASLHFMVITLDDDALSASTMQLLLPMSEGELRMPNVQRWQNPVVCTGEVVDGVWHDNGQLETSLLNGMLRIKIDQHHALAMLLICEASESAKAARRVETLVKEPWKMR